MALPLANNADGGTNGTTVTTGNSGGASGNAWDVVSIGTGATLTYDNTAANIAHGSGLGYKIVEPATAASAFMGWTTSLGTLVTNQRLAGRFYYVPGAGVPSSSIRLLRVLTTSTILLSIYHGSGTGHIEIHNNAGTLVGSTPTLALTTGTLYRIEFDFTGVGTASGAGTVNVYLGDSTSTVDTTTGSALAFGTTAPNTVRFGVTTANSSPSVSHWFDAIQLNATGMPGPELTGASMAIPAWRRAHSGLYLPAMR